MAKVKIFTTPSCPWCHKTKEWLKEHKIKYEEKNVQEDEKARNEMIEKSGQMGVPVVEIGDQIIVGFDEDTLGKALLKKKAA